MIMCTGNKRFWIGPILEIFQMFHYLIVAYTEGDIYAFAERLSASQKVSSSME
jgi:hypothetical protein